MRYFYQLMFADVSFCSVDMRGLPLLPQIEQLTGAGTGIGANVFRVRVRTPRTWRFSG
jgi:hypothetical protein